MTSQATYSLRTQAKCLVPHAADQDRHGFLVGTANLRGPNEIRVLRYYEDEDELDCAAVYLHEGEVASMSACPTDASVVLTTSTNSEGLPCAGIFRMRDLPGDETEPSGDSGAAGGMIPKGLDRIAALPPQRSGCRLLQAQFVPSEEALASAANTGGTESPGGRLRASGAGVDSCRVMAVDDTSLRLFALRSDGSLSATAAVLDIPTAHDATFLGGLAWADSLNGGVTVAVAHDSSISLWDTRSGDRTAFIERAVSVMPGGGCVRGLSFNPNRPFFLASGGDDYCAKIWDTRKAGAGAGPVKILQGHSHWVTSVAFNQFHDQLLLSGGADGRVNLWRVSSVSSAPLLELGEEDLLSPQSHSHSHLQQQQHQHAASASSSEGKKHHHHHAEPRLAPDVAIRATATTAAATAAMGGGGGGGHHHHPLSPAAAALADSAAEGTHEDSVSSVCWSPGSAWVYASLSYPTGKVNVGLVPSAEKYKILL